jgi:hypothetical protein
MLNLDPTGSTEVQSVPCDCADCDEQTKHDHGCGFDPKLAGKARGIPAGGRADDAAMRTCPQFYLRQPAAQEVYADLKDYRRGSLDVDRLPAAYLFLLREADSAEEEWGRVQQQQVAEQGRARAKAEE